MFRATPHVGSSFSGSNRVGMPAIVSVALELLVGILDVYAASNATVDVVAVRSATMLRTVELLEAKTDVKLRFSRKESTIVVAPVDVNCRGDALASNELADVDGADVVADPDMLVNGSDWALLGNRVVGRIKVNVVKIGSLDGNVDAVLSDCDGVVNSVVVVADEAKVDLGEKDAIVLKSLSALSSSMAVSHCETPVRTMHPATQRVISSAELWASHRYKDLREMFCRPACSSS